MKLTQRITYAYQRATERPPLRPHAIVKALSRCYDMDDDLTLSWHYWTPRGVGLWNQFGPPCQWLIEVLQHVNRFLRENDYRAC